MLRRLQHHLSGPYVEVCGTDVRASRRSRRHGPTDMDITILDRVGADVDIEPIIALSTHTPVPGRACRVVDQGFGPEDRSAIPGQEVQGSAIDRLDEGRAGGAAAADVMRCMAYVQVLE